MNKIKIFFSNNLRKLLSIVVFFFFIFIWTSLTSEDPDIFFHIFLALFATVIFVFVNWAFE